ncbi:MAG: glycosyltransferase family 2 protein, partial [Pannonibacter indicus]
MSQTPAISAVLPVYNGEAYVREAVESILAQTFTDFELIIINDGSTDGSGAILRELAARDPRIVLVERANGGLVSALNEGIERAQAGLIARMDADDVAMPKRFALQHARMEAEPELGVLGSFIRIMDKAGRTIRLGDYPVSVAEAARFMEHGCPVAHPTVMMRREAVLKAGGYRKLFS